MVIDVHGHYFPDARFAGPEDTGCLSDLPAQAILQGRKVAGTAPGLTDLGRQVLDMDRQGIQCRLLSIPPFLFCYEAEEAVSWCRTLNDAMAEDIAPYGSRFRLLATLPMGNVDAACGELERIMKHPSFVGAQIATNLAGIELDDDTLAPFWSLVQELDAFILLHPHYTLEHPRLKDFHLRNLVGNPLDTTLAAFRLMAGGVLERYPRLNICLSHGGGYLSLALGRFERGRVVRQELAHMESSFGELSRKLYCDTILHDSQSLAFLVDRIGASQVLLGTDYPFDMGDPDPVASVRGLEDFQQERILGGNAVGLLGGKLS